MLVLSISVRVSRPTHRDGNKQRALSFLIDERELEGIGEFTRQVLEVVSNRSHVSAASVSIKQALPPPVMSLSDCGCDFLDRLDHWEAEAAEALREFRGD